MSDNADTEVMEIENPHTAAEATSTGPKETPQDTSRTGRCEWRKAPRRRLPAYVMHG